MKRRFHRLLPATLLFLFVTIGCAALTDAGPDGSDREAAMLEARVFDLINLYREEQGLDPLKANAELADIAREHSQAMAQGHAAFGHDGFQKRAEVVIRHAIGTSVGENVAWNMGFRDVAKQAVQGWIQSPGHHANIVGEYELTGIAVAKGSGGRYYLTQLFVR